MRLNSEILIQNNKVCLVPYRKTHVIKYHKWMEDSELREQTASERLSLEDEYSMQKTWLEDEKKFWAFTECTFIVLDRLTFEKTNDEIDSMIGDVNLYLTDNESNVEAELGLMIAEKSFRGRGYGLETVLSMIRFGIEKLEISKFVAIISKSNTKCIALFENILFQSESESSIFNEIKLSKIVDSHWTEWIMGKTPYYKELTTISNF